MPGKPIQRMREDAERADAEAARLEAAGDAAGAVKAKAKAERLRAGAEKMAEARKIRVAGKRHPNKEIREARKSAVKLVGGKAAAYDEIADISSLAATAGELAASIATQGVRPGTVLRLPPQGEPEPLGEGEFALASAVVTASAGDGTSRPPDASLPRDRWLAEAFPTLSESERVRCARFLAIMASCAAEAPSGSSRGATVAERALLGAGLSYTAFEALRGREVQFDAAQAAITAARKRAVMNIMEEELWRRAVEGQTDQALTRDGEVVDVRKYDNNLAFNLLKYGHEQYSKQMAKEKIAANAMTLVISNGCAPEMRRAEPAPKAIEATEVPRGQ